MNTDIMSSGAYESSVMTNRHLHVFAIVLFVGFLVWWNSDLNSQAFYYMVVVIMYTSFVVTRAWLAERKYFGRIGPIDGVVSSGSGLGVALLSKTKTVFKNQQRKENNENAGVPVAAATST